VPTTTVTYSGFVNGEDSSVIDTLASVSSAQSGVVNAGTYADNYTAGDAADGNYSFKYVKGNLTVDKKLLTVTADAQSATYGDTLGTLTYRTSGLVGDDSLTGALTTAYGGAGTVLKHANGFDVSGSPFAITKGSLDNSNYSISYTGANLTLEAKELNVSANNKTITFGSIEPALTYSYTGLVSGDSSASFSGALARESGNGAGAYSILRNTLAATGNYTIGSYNAGVFTIVAAPNTLLVIPNTVVIASQTPEMNIHNSSNFGDTLMTSSSGGGVVQTKTTAPASDDFPDYDAKKEDAGKEDAKEDAGKEDTKKEDAGDTLITPLQSVKMQGGLLRIEPALARRFGLDSNQDTQF
jgi:hypothetical protein